MWIGKIHRCSFLCLCLRLFLRFRHLRLVRYFVLRRGYWLWLVRCFILRRGFLFQICSKIETFSSEIKVLRSKVKVLCSKIETICS